MYVVVLSLRTLERYTFPHNMCTCSQQFVMSSKRMHVVQSNDYMYLNLADVLHSWCFTWKSANQFTAYILKAALNVYQLRTKPLHDTLRGHIPKSWGHKKVLLPRVAHCSLEAWRDFIARSWGESQHSRRILPGLTLRISRLRSMYLPVGK